MTEYKLVVVGGKYLQWHLDYLDALPFTMSVLQLVAWASLL